MRIRWRGLELPTRLVCDKETLTDTYGRFVAEPFERGCGTTVGNSLRRVLLSSLEGSAVTSIKIKGVQHEFTSISGVVEDTTEIILNIKGLLVRLHSDIEKTITIERHEKGEVTGADIVTDDTVEIINPNLHIATLSENVDFVVEMTVNKGRGYITAEENRSNDQMVGTIAVDSLFSPVQRVRYTTQDTRVGQKTNYDRLLMEIWTNGITSPEMALVEASKILRKHLNPFIQYFDFPGELRAGPPLEEVEEEQTIPKELENKMNMSVSELDLSVRISNCLRVENIRTIGELASLSEEDLLKIRNLGRTSMNEIKKKLVSMGLPAAADIGVTEKG